MNPTHHNLRRVFQQGFSVRDIVRALPSFDHTTPAQQVKQIMEAKGFDVVGIRTDGTVTAFLEQQDLGQGNCGDHAQAFDPSEVVLASMPLAELVLRLKEQPRLFVETLDQVGGVVSRDDMQKPPARMWLFGMVTLIEMRFSQMIERFCPGDEWKSFLSESRVRKAEELLAERTRRNQQLCLTDCLQFSDKTQIVARNQQLRALTRFESRRQIEEVSKQLEKLRNNLAHAQDIVSNDWEMIVALAENLDVVLDGPPGLADTQ